MDNAEKRNISKIKIAVEIDQENNNKDIWTILIAAKDRGGLFISVFKRITQENKIFSLCPDSYFAQGQFRN